MSCNCNHSGFHCITLIIAVVLGIFAGVQVYLANLAWLALGSWLAFGIAAGALVLLFAGLLAAARLEDRGIRRCFCKAARYLPLTILGAILAIALALLVSLTAYTVLVAILVGIAAFFTWLTLSSLAGLIRCIACELCS